MKRKKTNKKIMMKFHEKLMENGGVYADWHKHPKHKIVQWLLLLVVVAGIGYGLYIRIQDPNASTYGSYSSAKNDKINKGGTVGRAQDYVLVKFLSNVSEAQAQAKLSKRGSVQIEELPQIKVKKVKVPNGMEPEDFVQDLIETEPGVEFAEVDAIVEPSAIPNDPYYSSQWHWPRISLPEAWDSSTGSPVVIIAIADTGTDCNHEDLVSRCVPGTNTAGGTGTVDDNGHGTMTAGTAAATGNNGIGVTGACWNCKIMPIKISMDAGGNATASAAANAITYAASHGAKVINISYIFYDSSTVTSAAHNMVNQGGVVTMSAGNNGQNLTNSDNPYILTVGGTDPNDARYSWSNYGRAVDVVAPGCVYITYNGGGYIPNACGTSFSAPITAGVAGLVFSANFNLTGDQVQNIIKGNTDDIGAAGFDPIFSWGRVNAYKAVLAAGSETPPPADTQAPSAPTNLSGILVNQSTINLSWSASSDNVGVTDYQVLRNDSLIGNTSGTSYTDGSVSAGNTYAYTVKATDASGNLSGSSNTFTIQTSQPVTNLTIGNFGTTAITATTARVTWTTSSASTGTVAFGTSSTSLNRSVTDNTLSTTHTVTLTGLTNSTNYFYKITAVASGGSPTTQTGILKFRTPKK